MVSAVDRRNAGVVTSFEPDGRQARLDTIDCDRRQQQHAGRAYGGHATQLKANFLELVRARRQTAADGCRAAA